MILKPYMKVTSDTTKNMQKAIDSMKGNMTLVGIPQNDNARQEEGPIGNAGILFINEFGSPGQNIPARPVMAIGIKNAQPALAEEFKKCAQAALTKGFQAIDQYYERVGIIASNSIKKVINDQDGIEGPSEATLKARESRGFKGTKSLVVTGQLRNAITYVVRGK